MAKLELDQSEWNALNRILLIAEVRIKTDLKEGFEKQQAEAALRVAEKIILAAEIDEPEYGQDEADEDRYNEEKGN